MFGIEEIKKDISEIRQELAKKPDKLERDVYERLADLEVKMGKLWTLLLEETPNKKTKLSKFGRLFGGRAKALQQ